jgi:hypothetical protein
MYIITKEREEEDNADKTSFLSELCRTKFRLPTDAFQFAANLATLVAWILNNLNRYNSLL